MPAKDFYHENVRNSLMKDGWTITHDPFRLPMGSRSAFIDVGATKVFAAERQGQKIAVEIKSFLSTSPVSELEKAMGQYDLYSMFLEDEDPERLLFLAIPFFAFRDFFSEEIGQRVINRKNLRIIVFEPEKQEIVQWIT